MATRQSNSSTISGHNTYNPPPVSLYICNLSLLHFFLQPKL